jgi:hypothetical protein
MFKALPYGKIFLLMGKKDRISLLGVEETPLMHSFNAI